MWCTWQFAGVEDFGMAFVLRASQTILKINHDKKTQKQGASWFRFKPHALRISERNLVDLSMKFIQVADVYLKCEK